MNDLISAGTKIANDAATTLTSTANKVVQSAGTVGQGLSNAIADPSSLLKSAQSGLTNLASNIQDKAAGSVDALQLSLKNTFDFGGNVTEYLKGKKQLVPFTRKLPWPNVLHNYASYNYIFTLSILDKTQYNFPEDSYKKGKLGQIICKSGSGDPDNRVQIAVGKFDYYIDNVRVEGSMGLDKTTGNTNAHSITFDVTEPYSMGLFFQSLQVGALEQGYKNYIEAPFLLTLEFKGHLNAEYQGVPGDALTIERTTKHFPLRIRNLEMNVTNRGAVYTVEAYPYNEKAFSTTYTQLKQDVAIKGNSVVELLQTGEQSLQKVLNDQYKEAAKKAETDADQILIYFPSDPASSTTATPTTDQGATTSQSTATTSSSDVNARLKISTGANSTLVQNTADVNGIGNSSMGFDSFKGGVSPFAGDSFAFDPEKKIYTRDRITINPTERLMSFSQGGDITDVINQVILTSEYGSKALKASQLSETGKIAWWRIDSQVYILPSEKNDTKKGTDPKLIVYRVVPYMIDSSIFLPVNETNTKSKQAALQAVKEYNYIYTSKNLDILDFTLNFQTGFYQAMHFDAGKNTEATQTAKQTGSTSEAEPARAKAPSSGKEFDKNNPPAKVNNDQVKSKEYNKGGSGVETPQTIAARQAHNVFIAGHDMVQVNLQILGDPYYLGDSGLGNYSAKSTTNENVNADDSINYENGDVYIKMNFRTPIDLDVSKGAYNFGPTQLITQVSGLYRVTTCESTFAAGKFSQNLTLTRMPGQIPESDTSAGSSRQTLLNEATNVTAAQYGTNAGSQQTEMLAAQDDFGPNASGIAGVESGSQQDNMLAAQNAGFE
jgi:hypothetical protein